MTSRLRYLEVILGAMSWLQNVKNPSPLIERLLDLNLDANDTTAVLEVCGRDSRNLGSYYFWYLEKKLVAGLLRHTDGDTLLKALTRFDRSDYTQLDSLLDIQCGSVIAFPHYGHYIPAVLGVVNHVSKRRDIAVFYADPSSHPGNSVFDDLHITIFQNRPRPAKVIHANREGLIKALRFLKAGGILLMFPDVYENLDETFAIPFFDRALNVMLGSAMLARKANGTLIPALSLSPGGLQFATCFGDPIQAPGNSQASATKSLRTMALLCDYEATARLFQWYEHRMATRLHCWQYIREHFSAQSPFTLLDPCRFDAVWDSFLKDPRIVPPISTSLELHTPS